MLKIYPYIDNGAEYRWRLKSPNGRVLADSGEGYVSLDGVFRAIANVQYELANGTAVFEEYKDAEGKHRWRMKDHNHLVIADSGQGYKGRSGLRNAMAVIVEDGARQEIVVVNDAL